MSDSFFDRIANLGDELRAVYRSLQELYDNVIGSVISTEAQPKPTAPKDVTDGISLHPTPKHDTQKLNIPSKPAVSPAPIVQTLSPSVVVEWAKPPKPALQSHTDICQKYGLYPLTFLTDTTALNGLANRTSAEVRKQFFSGQIVGVTGHSPYNLYDVRILARRLGATVGFNGLWQADQLFIIGREGFDTAYLRRSVEVGLRKGFVCRYITQDALAELLLWGKEPQYYRGDPRIGAHPGLAYLARLGFAWPTTNASPSEISAVVEEPNGWKDKHDLRAIYGYSVDTRESLSVVERQQRLRRAVAGLGLSAVAEHIAWLIKNAKRRHDGRMHGAIEKWEDDMDWLYDTFYKNSIHRFIWPTVYRRRGRR